MSLYPETNSRRIALSQDGMWNFRFDPESIGEKEKWMNRLDSSISIPVPASFADLFTDQYSKNYCGDFWYEKDIFVPDLEGRVQLRFGSVAHRCTIYVNGEALASQGTQCAVCLYGIRYRYPGNRTQAAKCHVVAGIPERISL